MHDDPRDSRSSSGPVNTSRALSGTELADLLRGRRVERVQPYPILQNVGDGSDRGGPLVA